MQAGRQACITLLPSSGFPSSYNVHTTYPSHVVTVIGLCPPASAPSCTRSTSVPSMLVDLFFYHYTPGNHNYTPVNHTNTHQHKRAPKQRDRERWMDSTCKPPKKGWEKTVSTLGRQSNTEFFPPGLPPSAPSLRRERGVLFCFSHRNKPQAKKQLIARKEKETTSLFSPVPRLSPQKAWPRPSAAMASVCSSPTVSR